MELFLESDYYPKSIVVTNGKEGIQGEKPRTKWLFGLNVFGQLVLIVGTNVLDLVFWGRERL